MDDHVTGFFFWRVDRVTHSDQREDVVHVRADVDLHKAHHHSHLLEEELQCRKSTRRKESKKISGIDQPEANR